MNLNEIEAAWREGYAAGYSNGYDDASAYELGAARNANTMRRALEEAWNDSEAKATIDKLNEPERTETPLP